MGRPPLIETVEDLRARCWFSAAGILVALVATVAMATTERNVWAPAAVVYLLLFLGAGPLVLLRTLPLWTVVRYGVLLSCSVLVLVGAAMAFISWHPVIVGVIVVGASLVCHLAATRRWLLVLRTEPGQSRSARRTFRAGVSRREMSAVGAYVGGTALWVLGSTMSAPAHPGYQGTLAVLPIIWYAGIILILIGVAISVRARGYCIAIGVVALLAVLDLTPSILFPLARYPWTAKHVGVTQLILHQGTVNRTIDIYQAWPGFFAAMAWVCKLSGIRDPYSLARLWPAIVDLLTLVPFSGIAARFLGAGRRAGLACGLLIVGETVGQNYYSPQSLGVVLALGLVCSALALRAVDTTRRRAAWVVFVSGSFAIALTHQLSPYMACAFLIVLTLFGFVRPLWVTAVPLVLSLAWALSNLLQVKKYFNVNEIGNLTGNVRVKQISTVPTHLAELGHVNFYALVASALILGAAAVAAAVRSRSRQVIALCGCAASSGGLLVFQQYGSEGSFRVLLFAVPWLAIAAAACPVRSPVRSEHMRARRHSVNRSLILAPLALLTALYLIADYGLDWVSTVQPSDIAVEQHFERTAPRGSFLFGLAYAGYVPTQSTRRYDLFNYRVYSDVAAVRSAEGAVADVRLFSEYLVYTYAKKYYTPHVYAELGPELDRSGVLYGIWTSPQYVAFGAAMRSSGWWAPRASSGASTLYELKTSAIAPLQKLIAQTGGAFNIG